MRGKRIVARSLRYQSPLDQGFASDRRFPVTLYKEQWLKLLNMSDEIRAFIAANDGQLKTKG